MGTHEDQSLYCHLIFRPPPSLSSTPPLGPSLHHRFGAPGWGQKNILEGQIREGGQQNLSRGPESWKGLTHLPTRCTNTWAASSSSPRTMESRQRCEGLGEEGVHKRVEGGHLGKFGEGANSELSTFFLLFFFLRNFFSLSADDFTISWGWWWWWGEQEIWAFAPPTPNARQSLTFHQKPEFQTFLKMRWRLLPSPASAPSLLSPFPPPPPPPTAPVSSLQFWPRRPNQAGRRPQVHSSSHCHAAEIKDTSLGWAPAKRFKSKSGRGSPEPQLSATCKGCLETFCPEPLGMELDTGSGAGGGAVAVTPSLPTKPTFQSQGSLNTLQNPSDGASPDSHL